MSTGRVGPADGLYLLAKRKLPGTRRNRGPVRPTQGEPRRAAGRLSRVPSDFRRWAAERGFSTGLILPAALVVLTLAVYVQVWRFEFITLDDVPFVSTNPHVRAGLTLDGIKWAFDRFYAANWIPFMWISLMLDATAFDAWAGGYHMTNVLLHVVNVLLLFRVIKQATGRDFMAAFVAALFAIHPIHAESVAWVSERKDVLSILFGLLSLSAYLNYASRRRMGPYMLSLLFFVGSLMSKQTLVTLPCVLLLLDYWPLRRLSLRAVAEKIPLFVVSALFSVVAMRAQAYGLAVRSLDVTPLSVRVANSLIAYAIYLQKAFAPWNLGIFYAYSTEISLFRVSLAIGLLVLLTAAAIDARRRFPFFTVGWFWFLGTLVPMIGLVQVGSQQMADRYAYFSFIGLYLALAGFVTSARVAIPIVVAFAVVGFVQVGYWHDTIGIVRHTAEVTDDNSFVRFVLGDALIADNRVDEGLEEFRQGVRIAPHSAASHDKLGQSLLRFGELPEALQEFQITLALDDSLASAHSGLGWIAMMKKENATANREFQRALALDPGDQDNYFNLALLHKNMNDFQKSIDYCQQALAVNDRMLSARRLMTENLRQMKRWDEAAEQLRLILAAEPDDAQSRQKLDEAISLGKGQATKGK